MTLGVAYLDVFNNVVTPRTRELQKIGIVKDCVGSEPADSCHQHQPLVLRERRGWCDPPPQEASWEWAAKEEQPWDLRCMWSNAWNPMEDTSRPPSNPPQKKEEEKSWSLPRHGPRRHLRKVTTEESRHGILQCAEDGRPRVQEAHQEVQQNEQ